MAPRTPLVQINANKRKHFELSPHTRGKIEGKYAVDANFASVDRTFKIDPTCARRTVKQAPQRPHGISLP